MITNMENSQATINENDINCFEKRFGIVLPEDYKRFLIKYNGGKPSPRRFKTIDNKTITSLLLILPLADIQSENLASNYISFNQGNKIPKNLLPIGQDPIKNKICMSIGGEDVGYIYYWDMDEDFGNAPSYDNMFLVAKSFTDFINSLCEAL